MALISQMPRKSKNRIINLSNEDLSSLCVYDTVQRAYCKLTGLASGHISIQDLRKVLGRQRREDILSLLSRISFEGLIDLEVYEEGIQTVFIIIVNPLPAETELRTSDKVKSESSKEIIKAFREYELKKLGSPAAGETGKDFRLAATLRTRTSDINILRAMKEYWKLSADLRLGSFQDFYNRFQEMLNRVLSDIEMEQAIVRSKRRPIEQQINKVREAVRAKSESMIRFEQTKLLEMIANDPNQEYEFTPFTEEDIARIVQ